MTNEEAAKFHAIGDLLWEKAKEAKAAGFHDLADTLITICDMLHARGSGVRKKYDSII